MLLANSRHSPVRGVMRPKREGSPQFRMPPVVRMGHAMAAASVLSEVGVPVHRRLRETGLPSLCQEADALVPLSRVWRLFDRASRLDVPEIGWWAGREVGEKNLNREVLARLQRSPTLYRSLFELIRLASAEASDIRLGIRGRHDDILFYTHYPGLEKEPGYMQSQYYQLQVYVAIVRHFCGSNWMPEEMGIQGPSTPLIMKAALPDCRILTGQSAGYVAISRSYLHRAARYPVPENGNSNDPVSAERVQYLDLLRALLKSYISEGYPTAQFAADLMGTSPRTLARRLAAFGTGYRAVVDDVRFTVARELVCQSDLKLSEIAVLVGFDDQSHFSRMFRRIGGVTPGEMRSTALGRVGVPAQKS